jgi:hypothetical protein
MARTRALVEGARVSKAKLQYANGMNLGIISSEEFEIDSVWFRAEAFRDDDGKLEYECFTRVGAYWRLCTSSMLPTYCPKVVDSIGNRLLQRARIACGELQLL